MTEPPCPTVCIVGAFDRFNYGDLLFAHLAAHLVRQRMPLARVSFHAMRACDLSDAGGVAVTGQRDLYRRLRAAPGAGIVMVAGGGVLSANWTSMHLYLLDGARLKRHRRLARRLPARLMETLVRLRYGVPNQVPMSFDPQEFGPRPPAVIYNAVGGRSVAGFPPSQVGWIRAAWCRAAWLSVRDAAAQRTVTEIGAPQPPLSPDSAVIMRDVYDDAALEQHRQRLFDRAATRPDRPYLCVQIRVGTFRAGRAALIAQLDEIVQRQGCDIVLFTIGRAAGHEDQVAQAAIARALPDAPWLHAAPLDTTVPEIMALIAGSSGYVGTSLHGYITAFAHGVPRVGLDRVEKLIGFRDAWDLDTMPAGVPADDLARAVAVAMDHPAEAMTRVARDVAARYYDDVDSMWAAMDSRRDGKKT